MTVAKPSVAVKQLPIAVEREEETTSARHAASSSSLCPSQSDAHPQVDAHAQAEQPQQDVDETTTQEEN